MSPEERLPTPEGIDRVLAFLPVLRVGAGLYTIDVEKSPLAPYAYSEQVNELIQRLYEEGFVIPFDWTAWREEALEYIENPLLVAGADLDTICRLLTTHVRAERYVSGHLAAMIDNGHLVHVLERLAILRRAWEVE